MKIILPPVKRLTAAGLPVGAVFRSSGGSVYLLVRHGAEVKPVHLDCGGDARLCDVTPDELDIDKYFPDATLTLKPEGGAP